MRNKQKHRPTYSNVIEKYKDRNIRIWLSYDPSPNIGYILDYEILKDPDKSDFLNDRTNSWYGLLLGYRQAKIFIRSVSKGGWKWYKKKALKFKSSEGFVLGDYINENWIGKDMRIHLEDYENKIKKLYDYDNI